MGNTLFQEVRELVSLADFMRDIGHPPNSRGMCICPLHSEKTASFKIYETEQRFKCFGCHEYGDITDLASEYWNCSKYEALKKLDSSYNLGLLSGKSKPIIKKESKAFSLDIGQWQKNSLDVIAEICRELHWYIVNYDEWEDIIPCDLISLKAEAYYFDELHDEILMCDPMESYRRYHEEIKEYAERLRECKEYTSYWLIEGSKKLEQRIRQSVQS